MMTFIFRSLCFYYILMVHTAHASQCQYVANFTPHHTILSLGSIMVPHRLAVGSVIRELTVNEIDNYPIMVECSSPAYAQWGNSLFTLSSEHDNTLYQTNIDGIGLRFIPLEQTLGRDRLPLVNQSPYSCHTSNYRYRYCGSALKGIRIQLIKTKSIVGSGELSTDQLIEASIGNLPVQSYRFVNTKIMTPSCEFVEKHKRVKMNKVKQRQFQGIGSHSTPVPFYLTLNCSGKTSVGIILRGRSSHYADNSVIALDKRPDSAQGIGLRIRFQGEALPLNQIFHLGTSFNREAYAVYFDAQYVQTQASVRAGKANATATLQIVYP
ncbi:fimbrial protein [Providencia vermicola]|uniref:fimbrial protein n=1 Tax=Providencia TaxID=586 RepID=UPI00234BD55E|nr:MULTISPECIES: fimbrial protein [Providencia]WER20558.1 fimbrial protein [Providencia stuartii]WER24676.1 fimbrial protein [Providencia stuartii]WER28767.1 fimbrial protein [Providencia stuartii]